MGAYPELVPRRHRYRRNRWWGSAIFVIFLAACGGLSDGSLVDDSTQPTVPAVQPCADVVDARLSRTGDAHRIDVTVRSGDTGWDKYADAWVVRTLDGEVLGERVLAHPHETEQPFTRSLSGVIIPDGVAEVEVAARDSVNGFCGETLTVAVS